MKEKISTVQFIVLVTCFIGIVAIIGIIVSFVDDIFPSSSLKGEKAFIQKHGVLNRYYCAKGYLITEGYAAGKLYREMMFNTIGDPILCDKGDFTITGAEDN